MTQIISLKDFILPTELENENLYKSIKNKNFKTTDYVYIDSYNNACSSTRYQRVILPTDYAIANGAMSDPTCPT